jgi:hypothetical protein
VDKERVGDYSASLAKLLIFWLAGRGVFKYMKDIVSRDVETSRHHMFDKSVEGVESGLKEMISDIQGTITDDIKKVFAGIANDYRTIVEQSQNAEESALNGEITALLTSTLTKSSDTPQPKGEHTGSPQNLTKDHHR